MRNIELLSPAGNFDCLVAAVNNGANAVYLGGKNFSARAFAGNFDEEELIKAVRFAHLHDVRVFVTLNTLLSEAEFANAIRMADFYYKAQVDALLIQDFGLYYVLKNRYPDFELHCSTQMHVHNVEGVRTAKKLGFKRVVLARESSLELIRDACKEGIEIETFVHGAICVSYSGQCLMSSSVKNRSANKGMCAQCCRLRYELYEEEEEGKRVKTQTDYLLSPKDMFLLQDIPALIDAGVSSFKIEGRMKSPAYVGYVTRMYRKAIDACLQNREFSLSDQELENLKVLFNRNFTNDLLHSRKDLFGQKSPNHLGIAIGETLYYRNGLQYIRLNKTLNQFDGIRINDYGCIVNRLYLDSKLVSHAGKGQTAAIESDVPLKGIVYKTQDHLLEEEIGKTPEKKVPLSVCVTLIPNEKAKVQLVHSGISYTFFSDTVVQEAKNAPLTYENLKKQFSRLNDTVYELTEFAAESKGAFLSVSQLNEIRREAVRCFDEFRLSSFHREVLPADYPEQVPYADAVHEQMIQKDDFIYLGDKAYPIFYVINPGSIYSSSDLAVVCEPGGLFLSAKEKIAYYTLNCSNSYAYEFFQKLGFRYIVLSSELNDSQIADLIRAYEERNHERIYPYVFVKGDRILMYIHTDPFGRYMLPEKRYLLKENRNQYRIRKHGDITELIENGMAFHKEDPSYGSLCVTLRNDD